MRREASLAGGDTVDFVANIHGVSEATRHNNASAVKVNERRCVARKSRGNCRRRWRTSTWVEQVQAVVGGGIGSWLIQSKC